MLENGLRMGDIATFDPAHATPIDALSIQQIDVVRGPATILYGPNTIGGLVNVITNLVPIASDRPLSGTAVVEGNSVSNEYAGYINNVYTLGKSGHSACRLQRTCIRRTSGSPLGAYTVPGERISAFAFNQTRSPAIAPARAGQGIRTRADSAWSASASIISRRITACPGCRPTPAGWTIRRLRRAFRNSAIPWNSAPS